MSRLIKSDCPRVTNGIPESFGGHWGPAFYTLFNEKNSELDEITATGRKLNLKSLGIVNGIVDEHTQTRYLLDFTRGENNGYGVDLINDTIYDYGKWNRDRPGGCQEKLDYCDWLERDSIVRRSACSAAQFICQSDVEGMFYTFNLEGRGTYDIVSPSTLMTRAGLTRHSAFVQEKTFLPTTGG